MTGTTVCPVHVAGDTALHIASLFGHEAAALALLEAGADAGAVNEEDGSTVLHDAGGYAQHDL